MTSLATCIRKAGKALNESDADAIREIYQDYLADNMGAGEAAALAVNDYVEIMQAERTELVDRIRGAGGDVSSLTGGLRYSTERTQVPDQANEGPEYLKYLTDAEKADITDARAAHLERVWGELDVEEMSDVALAGVAKRGWYEASAHAIRDVFGSDAPRFAQLLAALSPQTSVENNLYNAVETWVNWVEAGRPKDEASILAIMGESVQGDKGEESVLDAWKNNAVTALSQPEGSNEPIVLSGSKVDSFWNNLVDNVNRVTNDAWMANYSGLSQNEFSPASKKVDGVDVQVTGGGYLGMTAAVRKAAETLSQRTGEEWSPAEIQETVWSWAKAAYELAESQGETRSVQELVAQGAVTDDIISDVSDFAILLSEGHLAQKLGEVYGTEVNALAARRGSIEKIRESRVTTRGVQARPESLARAARRLDRLRARRRAISATRVARDAIESGVRARGSNRGGLSGPYSRGSSKELLIPGAKARYDLDPEIARKLNAAGISTPPIFEINKTNVGKFVDAINTAKSENPFGASVYVYPKSQYRNMRMFMTEDGTAGFALNGDDIVSVFKDPISPINKAASSMALLGVQEGGRRLDNFDTALTQIYGEVGFKPVARIPFDPTQAPAEWDADTFSAFQNGAPDVVFMVYGGKAAGDFKMAQGAMKKNYEDAVLAQRKSVAAENKKLLKGQEEVEPLTDEDTGIRYALSDEQENEINKRPEAPQSRIAKANMTVEDTLAKAKSTPAETIKNKLFDMAANAIPAYLSSIPRRNIPDFVGDAMPASKDYVNEAARMDGRRNELLSELSEIAKTWNLWATVNKDKARILGDVMHASTLTAVDPSKPYVSLKKPENMNDADKKIDLQRRRAHDVLKAELAKAGPKAAEIYVQVRDAYSNQREMVEKALQQRITESEASDSAKSSLLDELRQKFEAGRVAGPYFPLQRFGKWWAVARDAEGNVVSFSKFENRSDRNAWIKEFKADGYAATGGRASEVEQIAKALDPQFVAKMTNILEQSGDPNTQALADEVWQTYLRSLPEMSMRKQFLHRKNRLGFTADAIRAFGHNMFHGAHQIARLEHVYRMEDHLRTLKEQAVVAEGRADHNSDWAKPIYDEMMLRHEKAMSPQTSKWATGLTSLGFVWYLGATPAAAVVNLSQTAIVAFPVLAARFNTFGAAKQLARAGAEWASSTKSYGDKLRGDELKAWQEAHRIGLFEKTQAHDLAGVGEEGIDFTGKTKMAMDVVSFMFHKIEQANREVTFMASYRLGKQRGLSHDQAVLQAEDLTWDSHFDYTTTNRPRIMQSDAARVFLLFRQYSTNMSYRIARDFRETIMENPNLSKEQRNEARQRLAGIMGMTAILGGAASMPLWSTVQTVVNAMMNLGDDDEDDADFETAVKMTLTELFGAEASELIMHGAFDKYTGWTLSSRISLNNLWFRDPPSNVEGREKYMHYLGEAAGPVFGIGEDIFQGAMDLTGGQTQRGLERFVPKFMTDISKAYRYSTEGAETYRGDDLIPPEEFSWIELAGQGAGFSPAELNRQYEQNAAIKKKYNAVQRKRTNLLARYDLALRHKDKRETAKAIRDIQAFNKRQPRHMIDFDTMRTSIEGRRNLSAKSIGGMTLPDDYRYLFYENDFSGQMEERRRKAQEKRDAGNR